MNNLDPRDPQELAYLRAYRDATAMPDDARERVWARLAGGPGPFGGEAANDVTPVAEVVGRGGWLARPGLVLGVAVAVVTAAVVLGLRASDRTSDPSRPSEVVVGQPEPPPAPTVPAPSEPIAASTRSVELDAAPSVEPEVVAAPKPRKRRATRPASEPKPTSSSLAAERELIEQVHAALGRGEAELALTLLRRHAAEFETGVFVEEREGSWAIATCIAGRLDEGRAAARSFLASHPNSVLAARVRHKCELED